MSDLNIFRQWKQLAELQGRDFDLSFNAVAASEGRPIKKMKQWLTLSVAMLEHIKGNKMENEFSNEIAELKKVLDNINVE